MPTNRLFTVGEPWDSPARMDEAVRVRYDAQGEVVQAIFDSLWVSSFWSEGHEREHVEVDC